MNECKNLDEQGKCCRYKKQCNPEICQEREPWVMME